jgi:4-hydroxybenzoate polyprenyltransferase
MSTWAQRRMGRGYLIKQSNTFLEKLVGLIDITRPILSIMGALGVAAAIALTYGGIPGWTLCFPGFIASLLAKPVFMPLTTS